MVFLYYFLILFSWRFGLQLEIENWPINNANYGGRPHFRRWGGYVFFFQILFLFIFYFEIGREGLPAMPPNSDNTLVANYRLGSD